MSHGNADVERSFSENKLVVNHLRTRMSDATINGYRTTASFMQKYNKRPEQLPINAGVLRAVRNAKANYNQRIEAERVFAQKWKAEENCDIERTKLGQQIIDCERQIIEAEKVKKEGLEMLDLGCKRKDFMKMPAANAILQSSEDMKVNAQKKIDEVRVNLNKF